MRFIFSATIFVGFFLGLSITVFTQSESRDQVLGQIEAKRAELATLEKKFLSPSEEDQAAYAVFLKQPDTGLIRLLPRETYDKETKLTIRGGGAYYSFVRLTHAYGYGSDLELQQEYLSVGFAGADYGMIIKAGEVPLDEISIEHPSAFFLSAYKPATDEPQARVEQRRFGAGTTIDGMPYSERVKAEVGMTYVVRSINYSESDVLVAFKIIRKDTDGSLIIAWKLLKKYPKPELARNN